MSVLPSLASVSFAWLSAPTAASSAQTAIAQGASSRRHAGGSAQRLPDEGDRVVRDLSLKVAHRRGTATTTGSAGRSHLFCPFRQTPPLPGMGEHPQKGELG